MSDPPDMLDALIQDLRADGAVDSEGHFTLDREQARAKLQKFQLVDARRYVLELVQAAVLRGAEKIEFEIDADDMRMRFGGAPFTEAEIDDLYGSMFAGGDTRELQGVRQLALALNAAIGMNPKHIHLRSGTLELRMQPGQPDQIEAGKAELRGTQLHVKQRVRPRLVLDFFLNLGGRLAEEAYLRERCEYADVAIFLDGQRISRGLNITAPGQSSLRVHGRDFCGFMKVAVSTAGRPTRLDLVKDGVWIDSRELPDCGTNIVAVVEGQRLRKDVSQAKIVDGEALSTIIGALRHARWRLWTLAQDAAQASSADAIAASIRVQLLDHTRPDELRYDPLALALAEGVSWPDCRGSTRRVTLRELFELAQAGETLQFASTMYSELVADGAPIPLVEAHHIPRLSQPLGAPLIEADSLLAREQLRLRSRKAWIERVGAPVLPTHVQFLVDGPIDAEGIRGQVGVDAHTLYAPELEHPTQLLLYKQSRLLGRLELDLGIFNSWLVIEAEFEPSDDYQDAIRDSTFVRALLEALSALREPLARMLELAADHPNGANARGLVKRWLVALLDQPSQAALLSKAGADVAPSHYVELLPELRPAQLGPHDAPDPLARQRLFEQLEGPRLSLADLAAHHREHGQIRYLPSRPPDPRLTAPAVLLLGPGDRSIIRGLYGPDSCELFNLEPMLRELQHGDQPVVELERSREQIKRQLAVSGARIERWLVELEGEFEGFMVPAYSELGYSHDELDELDAAALETTTVRVYRAGRFLCNKQLKLGFGPLLAVIDHPQLQPDELWETVVEDQHWRGVEASLRAARERSFSLVARNYEGEVGVVRRWLARVLLHAAATDSSRVDAIRSLNMFDTVSGSVISLLMIERIIAKHGAVPIVERDTSWAPTRDPEIVKAEGSEAADLRRLLHTIGARTVDGSKQLRDQKPSKKLDTRPPMTEVELDRDRVLVIRDINGDRRRGEVGLSRIRTNPSLHLRLGTAGRLVHELHEHSPEFVVPIDALVIDDALPLDAQGEPQLSSKRYTQLLRQLRRSVPSLMIELCANWDARPKAFQRAAWPIIVAHLQAEAGAERRKVRERAVTAASGIAEFRDLWGTRHSLAQLIARSRKRPIGLLVELRPAVPDRELEGRLILLVDQAEAACLVAHARAEILDDRWEAELAWMHEIAEAPELSPPNLDDVALVQRRAQAAGGLECQLWIPRDYSPLTASSEPPQLIFARHGLELQRAALLDALPCAGIVSGEQLECSGGQLQLDERQASSLGRQVVIMYVNLAEQFKAGRLSAKDRERALEYLSWANACFEGDQLTALEGLGKHVKTLRALTSAVVPPTLRDALSHHEPSPTPPPADPAPEPGLTPEGPVELDPRSGPGSSPGSSPASPREHLLAALYEQLQWARARHADVLDQLRLTQLDLVDLGDTDDAPIARIRMTGIAVNTGHPLVARLLTPGPGGKLDPTDLTFVVSAIYTLMNHFAEDISDDDERVFVAQLAETLALSLRAGA